jgi:putative transposase
MALRKVALALGEFYHIYNRGVDKRTIFANHSDYVRFTELMYVTNSLVSVNMRDIKENKVNIFEYDRVEPIVAIGAWCLMSNHFHILATPLVENGLSKFMKKLTTGYSMYFNKKYDRTGSLFQGNYRAEHADTDNYLKYLYAYIHLNPVKLIDPTWKEEGIKDAQKSYDFCASFQYSSLQDYLNSIRPEKAILNTEPFPEYFQTTNEIKSELFEWLDYKNDIS